MKFHKFVRINIYSETIEEAPKSSIIGEIIRLRRFKFKITEKGQLVGFMNKFSNWLIYHGHKNTKTPRSDINKPVSCM